MKKLIFLLTIVSVSTILFTSCKSSAGPAGPVGPAGPAGPAGPTGTANVIYSSWFAPSAWTGSGTQSSFFDRAAPGVTAAIRDNGVILAYAMLIGDGTSVRPLPATTLAGGVVLVAWNHFSTAVGSIRFTAITESGGTFVPATTNQFRYVLIPGGVSGSRLTTGPAAGYTVEQVKTMSYDQIRELFGIPENGTNEK